MKTTIKTILCAAAVVLAAVSCQKSIEPASKAEEGKGTIDICVNGLMGEYTQQDGVKSSLVNNVRVAWAAGDVVYVFDGSKYLGKLTAALDKKADGQTDEDRYAKLGGTISAPATTPCVLSLVHSSLMTEPAAGAAVSELSIDMSAQSTETVPFVAYATMDYTGESISDVVVPFQFATSVIKVNCTGLKANTAITSATLSNVNTECKLTLFGDKAPVVAGGTNGTITRTGDSYFAAGKINAEGEAVFQIAVPALEEASQARILTVAQGSGKVEDKNFSMKGIEPATSVNTVCQLVNALPAGALKGEFSVGPNATDKVHFSQGNLRYVVSGQKWEFYENQYSFCNTTTYDGHHADTVSLFTWGYDATKSIVPDGTEYVSGHLTNGESFNKNEDWGYVFGSESSVWRTLSKDEWTYLFNDRTGAASKVGYATVGGVNGIIILPDNFTDPMKNKGSDAFVPKSSTGWTQNVYTSGDNWNAMEKAGAVFLPAAGWRFGTAILDVSDGHYWSSSASNITVAYIMQSSSSDVSLGNGADRDFGCSVRLVTDVSAAPAPTEPDYVVMKMGASGNNTLKWATKNLGATTVAGSYTTCYGDLYQWGSVNTLYDGFPYTSATEGSFTWKTGKTSGFVNDNREYTGNDATLPDANDVVKQTIGSGWRMPTSAEFKALYDACLDGSYNTTTNPSGASASVGKGVYWCTSYDGVAGCLFCDGTNKLFFPAAGCGEDTSLNYAGSSGVYWSSTLYDTDNADGLYFGSDDVNPQTNYYRYAGFPVRPVSD